MPGKSGGYTPVPRVSAGGSPIRKSRLKPRGYLDLVAGSCGQNSLLYHFPWRCGHVMRRRGGFRLKVPRCTGRSEMARSGLSTTSPS